MYIPIFEINNFILQPKVLPYQVIFKLQSCNDYFQSTFQFELIVSTIVIFTRMYKRVWKLFAATFEKNHNKTCHDSWRTRKKAQVFEAVKYLWNYAIAKSVNKTRLKIFFQILLLEVFEHQHSWVRNTCYLVVIHNIFEIRYRTYSNPFTKLKLEISSF